MHCYCVTHHGQPLEDVEKEIPQPKGTEVLLHVKAAGLCHTDLHLWEGYYDLGGGKRLSLADRGLKPPLTLSHEITGQVVAVGPDAESVKVGMVSLVHPWIGCGECQYCVHGEENLCIRPNQIGIHRAGGFAESIIVPKAKYLVNIEGLNPSEAAPLACAGVTTYSALKKFGNKIEHYPVVIIGAGGLGFMALKLLNAMNAKGTIMLDIDDNKLAEAQKAGAIATLNSKDENVISQLQQMTQGGPRLILDLVGNADSLYLAISSAGRGGHIVVCGLIGGELNLSIPLIPMRPLTIQGSYVDTVEELRELVELVKSKNVEAIPVTEYPIDQVNQAMQKLINGQVLGRLVLKHAV